MVTTQITIGTAAAKIYDLIKGGTPPAGAAISKTYPGLANGNGCQYLLLEGDPTNGGGVIYVGEGDVSATKRGMTLLAGDRMTHESGHGFNGIPLNNFWVLGDGAGLKLNVTITYA